MLVLSWLSLVSFIFHGSLKLLSSKLHPSRAVLSMPLFRFSMNNPRVASKILLLDYITVYNVI